MKFATVEEYLTAQPEQTRATLEELRQAIRSAAPDATEVISYQIPTFKYHGSLVAFGAAKDHCGFYVMSETAMSAYAEQVKAYSLAKTTVRFRIGEPIPSALVAGLVRERIAENTAK